MIYELVSAKACPFVQRVKILLEEKDLEYTHNVIDLEIPPSWFAEVSPLGKVPLLKIPGGRSLFESQVINEYLDEVEGQPLHPVDPVEKAEHRAWIEFVSNIIISFGAYYNAANKKILDDRIQRVNSLLSSLEEATGKGPFFKDDQFSLVDAAAAPLFSRIYLLNGFHTLNLLTPFQKLTAWSRSLLTWPSVKAVETDAFHQECLEVLRSREIYIRKYLGD